jgi:hypothetical protein
MAVYTAGIHSLPCGMLNYGLVFRFTNFAATTCSLECRTAPGICQSADTCFDERVDVQKLLNQNTGPE